MNHTALTLDNRLIVELVHVHEMHLEVAGYTLVQLYVNILIICSSAPFPERGAVTLCAHTGIISRNIVYRLKLIG